MAAASVRLIRSLDCRGTCLRPARRVQEVSEWERLVNSLVSEGRTDLYIPGSNSRLLSGELATYIAGRYVSIDVWPLSFREYLAFGAAYSNRDIGRTGEEFARFLRYGGFPGVHVVSLEYAPLEAIADNHPKYVLTLDPLAGDNTGGIRHLSIHDFLLSDTY